jgi:large subunit ribosomal protein L17
MATAEVKPEKDDRGEADHRSILQKLFSEIAPRYIGRPGGYTRILKRHEVRLGDAGATAYLELLKAGEVRSRAKPAYSAPAPAPAVQPSAPEQPEQQAPHEQPETSGAAAPEQPAEAPASTETPPANPS